MRIGFHTGYWSAGPPSGVAEAVRACDDWGVDSIWTAEAYGSDAFTPLAWWGATTSRVRLGTAVAQIAARTPTATAMAAMTLDHLSGGRFTLGLGVSGPQVVEGWYGTPYPRPLARTREFVAIVRDVLRREGPVRAEGAFYRLPLPDGLGKALRSTVHPLRADLPIHLAAEGPKNIALAAEIADGWLPLFYAPRLDAEFRGALAEGFAVRAGDLAGFEVSATVPVSLGTDQESAADAIRPFVALYAGGMGAKGANFHANALARLGYAQACAEIQSHWSAGDRPRAAAAVPIELVRDIALVGTPEQVAEQARGWRTTAVTTMVLQCPPEQWQAAAAAVHSGIAV